MSGLSQLLGGGLSVLLGICIFSYLLGDNPLYRFTLHVLIGVSSATAVVFVIRSVILPQAQFLLSATNTPFGYLLFFFPMLGGLLLFTRLWQSNKVFRVANVPLAFLVGVGAAVALAGAVRGTLLPQLQFSLSPLWQASPDWALALSGMLQRVILLIGTSLTLLSFLYILGIIPASADATGNAGNQPFRLNWREWWETPASIGRIFLWVLLAALYAGLLASGMTYFAERMLFVYDYVQQFFAYLAGLF